MRSQRRRPLLTLLVGILGLLIAPLWAASGTFAQAYRQCTQLNKVYISPANIGTMDFSQTRAQGHYELLETGIRIWTQSNTSLDKVAGYIPADIALADVDNFVVTQSANSGSIAPGGQLVVDANADGTLEGILVYEPWAYGTGNWWSNYNFGIGSGMGYNTYGTLDQIVAANPNARVKAFGFSLGSGVQGDWVIQSIQLNCELYVFDLTPPPTIGPCLTTSVVRVTPIQPRDFSYAETRATGHYEYTSGGLHIWTEGATSTDKVAGYKVVDFPLADVGAFAIDYQVVSGGRPGGQLRVDTDNDGISNGTLVYEPWAYGQGNWWSNYNFGIGSGMGYATFGTLNQILEVHPTAKVVAVGFSLGSGILGDGVLNSITAGCTQYVFGLEQVTPVEPQVNPIGACGQYGSIVLTDTPGVLYSVEPVGAVEGTVVVGAEPKTGYELIGYTGPWTYDLGTYQDCPLTELTAPAPTFINPACPTNQARVQFPQSDLVAYGAVGSVAPGGTVTVYASLKPGVTGYQLVGTTSWTHTFGPRQDCHVPVVYLTNVTR